MKSGFANFSGIIVFRPRNRCSNFTVDGIIYFSAHYKWVAKGVQQATGPLPLTTLMRTDIPHCLFSENPLTWISEGLISSTNRNIIECPQKSSPPKICLEVCIIALLLHPMYHRHFYNKLMIRNQLKLITILIHILSYKLQQRTIEIHSKTSASNQKLLYKKLAPSLQNSLADKVRRLPLPKLNGSSPKAHGSKESKKKPRRLLETFQAGLKNASRSCVSGGSPVGRKYRKPLPAAGTFVVPRNLAFRGLSHRASDERGLLLPSQWKQLPARV